MADAVYSTRSYKVECVVCGTERKVNAISQEHAFTEATASEGWTWRLSTEGQWCELLCADHARTPTGEYGDD